MQGPGSTFEVFSRSLPLSIDDVEWDDTVLRIGGRGWSLVILSPWRVVRAGRMAIGCDQAEASAVRAALAGKFIDACVAQSPHAPLDLALVLSSGAVLEVFSVHPLEPWSLRLPGGGTFFALPGE